MSATARPSSGELAKRILALAAPTTVLSALQVVALAVLIAVAVGIYVAGLQLLRLPEFTLLSGKIAQRLRRS